jgi:hypothetical protein
VVGDKVGLRIGHCGPGRRCSLRRRWARRVDGSLGMDNGFWVQRQVPGDG